MAPHRPLVVVSNRGPVTFALDASGRPVGRRGAGGLISGLGPQVRGTDAVWIAAAMTEGDRAVAKLGVTEAEGFHVRLLAFDADEFAAYYDDVCNTALWFAHHGLFDPVYAPSWPAGWVERSWDAYRRVNRAFADAVVRDAPEDAVVLVQDYHLCLVAAALGDRRPDLQHRPLLAHAVRHARDARRCCRPAVRDELLDGLWRPTTPAGSTPPGGPPTSMRAWRWPACPSAPRS